MLKQQKNTGHLQCDESPVGNTHAHTHTHTHKTPTRPALRLHHSCVATMPYCLISYIQWMCHIVTSETQSSAEKKKKKKQAKI